MTNFMRYAYLLLVNTTFGMRPSIGSTIYIYTYHKQAIQVHHAILKYTGTSRIKVGLYPSQCAPRINHTYIHRYRFDYQTKNGIVTSSYLTVDHHQSIKQGISLYRKWAHCSVRYNPLLIRTFSKPLIIKFIRFLI